MKYSLTSAALAALATTAIAAPSPIQPRAACSSAVTLTPGTNPFKGQTFWANPFYADEVNKAAANMSDSSLASAAKKVGQVGTFMWM